MTIFDEKDIYLHMCEKIEEDSINEHSFAVSLKKYDDKEDTSDIDTWYTDELLDLSDYEEERDSCHIKYDEKVLRAIIRSFREAQAAMIFIHSHSSLDDDIEIDFSDKDICFERHIINMAAKEQYTFPISFMVENLNQFKVHKHLENGDIENVEFVIPYENQTIGEPEIHIISGDGNYLFYSRSRNSVFKIERGLAEAILLLQKREQNSYSAELAVKKRIYDELNQIDEIEIIDDLTFIETHKINRLQLMVSMKCNLSCRYCYADGGSYGLDLGYMDSRMIQEVFSFIKEMRISSISSILFFGGEPLLAVDAIAEICNGMQQMVSDGIMKKIPVYTMVTNGTNYNSQIRDVLLKYQIRVTVSIDGPQIINDELRIYKDGRGSYEKVADNIKKMQNDGVEITAIEATYTSMHVRNGYSPKAVKQFLQDEFHVPYIYLGRCRGSEEYDIEDKVVADLVADTCDEETIWEADGGLRQKGKISGHKCAAGIMNLTILPNGDIYPCHSFIRNGTYKMGNICGFTSDHGDYDKVVTWLRKDSKKNRESCRNCWAQMICKGCPADKLNLGKVQIDENCMRYKKTLDSAISCCIQKDCMV